MNLIQTVLLISVVGGVVLFGGNYLLSGKQGRGNTPAVKPLVENIQRPSTSEDGPATASQSQKNTVILTAEGFSPKVLTIKAWETVTWNNNLGETATVNSDAHPAHTKYPPLNLGQFSAGQTLSLLFDQPVTYGYHNHLNPSQKGQIIVE